MLKRKVTARPERLSRLRVVLRTERSPVGHGPGPVRSKSRAQSRITGTCQAPGGAAEGDYGDHEGPLDHKVGVKRERQGGEGRMWEQTCLIRKEYVCIRCESNKKCGTFLAELLGGKIERMLPRMNTILQSSSGAWKLELHWRPCHLLTCVIFF